MDIRERVIRDPARLQAVRRLGLLDAPPDPALDRLTLLTQRVLHTPAAIICLVDSDRQVIHSAVGLPEPIDGRRETPLTHSICRLIVTSGRPLAVSDTRQDEQLKDHPAVTELGVAAYAASPLVTADGHVVGTLAVMDFTPRVWRTDELELLGHLAATAWTQIELLRARRELELQAAALRRASDARAALADSGLTATFTLAPDGTIQSLGESFDALTGWPAVEWVGRSLVSLVHTDDLPAVLDLLSRAMEGEVVQPLAARVRRRSGDHRSVEIHAAAQLDQGTVRRVHGTLRDVPPAGAGAARAEAAREAGRWSALLDHLPDPIYFKDSDSRFTRINRAQARVLGVDDPTDAIGKSDADFFPPEHAAAALADEQEIMTSGTPLVAKVERIEMVPGTERWFLATKMPLRNEAGEVIGTVGCSREITDMMRAEGELRRTLSLHSATLESTADGILVVDREGRITAYNHKLLALWRVPDELVALRQDERLLEHMVEQMKDPDGFLRRVRELYADVEASSLDILECADGRVFERYSQPQRIEGVIVGRVWSFRDVTERRRTEDQNRLLAHTIQSTGDIISITDLDGRFTFVNKAFLTTYGYAEAEIIGFTPALIDSPRNPPSLQAEIREATRNGTWRGELWNRRKDGTEFPIALTTSQIRDPDGRVVGLVGVWNDITQRRRSEAVQQAVYRIAEGANAAEGLDALLRAVHHIVSELMPAENLFVALYDRSAGLLTFPYFVDQVDTADAPRPLLPGLTEYVLRTGRPFLGTPEAVAALERRGDVELVGAPSVDWLGVPLKVGTDTIGVLAVQSYTEGVRYGLEELAILEFVSAQVAMAIARTRAAEQLQSSEHNYRQLFEGNPAAMFVYDAETLRFLAVNEAAVRRYGYTRAEFLGMTLMDMRPPEEAERLREVLAQYRGGTARATGLRHQRHDGSLIDVEVTFDDIEFEGRPARLAVVEDVTERHRLEGQLRQAQKMEAVGQLAGGIAHDFNNLLTAIVGYATLLERTLPADATAREEAQEIIGAARRAANLTHQLLAFSRKQVLRPSVVDVNVVIRDIERILHRVIGEHITLRTSLDPALAYVLADPSQLDQVIMNLAVNARDAMPGGGRITIETANVPLDSELAQVHPEARPGGYVLLAVSDTGTGLSPEAKAHLFEPFFTTKEVGKGTGLGLATVYGIVRQSGGFIGVDTELGRGTRFRIYLPRAASPASEPAKTTAPAPTARGAGTVLVVEDEAGVRHLARDVLRRCGYRVLEASDGAEALRLVEQEGSIDLLLTDVVMPGMSGAELALKFRALRPEARVLYASGYADDALDSHGLPAQGVPYLQKPFEPDDLVRRVRELLET
ncbi:MAG TPA: PAS domain S-box protein [Gemmatimonadales bacterium]|nr:PAS domain S-box protein [Gemmatimonadales bacterium]